MSSLKKRRITKACDHCRARKAKCDGKIPCAYCNDNSLECNYTESTKRRGVPSGYTRELETANFALQLILTKLVNEDDATEKKIINLLSNNVLKDQFISELNVLNINWYQQSNIRPLFEQFLADDLSKLQLDLKNSPKHQVVKGIPTGLNESTLSSNTSTLGTKGSMDPTIQHISEEPKPYQKFGLEYTKISLQYQGLSSSNSTFSTSAIQAYNKTLPPTQKSPFSVSSIFNIKSRSKIPLSNDLFQYPLNTRALVDSYFQVIHPWLPMVNRISIVRFIHTPSYRSNSSVDSNFIGLIWAILALGQMKFNGIMTDETRTLSQKCARNSIKALECTTSSTLETIQSMLLLGLFYYEIGEWDSSWVLTSSASRMAIDTRIMLSNPNAVETVARQRQRTWCGVYLLNLMLSLRLGRNPVVRKADFPLPKIDEEDWEEWESWTEETFNDDKMTPLKLESSRCLSIHNKLLEIVALLNLMVTSTLVSTADISSDKSEQTISLQSMKDQLNSWFETLPEYCQVKFYTIIGRPPNYIAFLHLFYGLSWAILELKALEIEKLEKSGMLNNKQYKAHISSISRNVSNILELYDLKQITIMIPYIDYVLSVSLKLNMEFGLDPSPEMLIMLENLSEVLPACNITFEILSLMFKKDPGKNWIKSNLEAKEQYKRSSDHTMRSPLNYESELNKLQNEIEIQSEPDLDSFLYGVPPPNDQNKMHQFMRNLGYVSKEDSNDNADTSLGYDEGQAPMLSTVLLSEPQELPMSNTSTSTNGMELDSILQSGIDSFNLQEYLKTFAK